MFARTLIAKRQAILAYSAQIKLKTKNVMSAFNVFYKLAHKTHHKSCNVSRSLYDNTVPTHLGLQYTFKTH